MQDNTENRSNPKDRNFDQEDVAGESKSTTGRKQKEEEAQDDYNAQDRNFDGTNSSGKPTATGHEPTDDNKEDEQTTNRNIDPSLRQGSGEEPHK